jgi:uncharacterized protein YggL (DUF469 family)
MDRDLPPNKRRSRRLRKKLHIGEFREDGFEVRFQLKAGLSDSQQLDVLDAFITEAIEARGLAFGGGEHGFVMRADRGSTTEEDRASVREWLQTCQAIEHAVVLEMRDAWYGWGGTYERDDGPLTEEDLAAIEGEALKHLPKGSVVRKASLLPMEAGSDTTQE